METDHCKICDLSLKKVCSNSVKVPRFRSQDELYLELKDFPRTKLLKRTKVCLTREMDLQKSSRNYFIKKKLDERIVNIGIELKWRSALLKLSGLNKIKTYQIHKYSPAILSRRKFQASPIMSRFWPSIRFPKVINVRNPTMYSTPSNRTNPQPEGWINASQNSDECNLIRQSGRHGRKRGLSQSWSILKSKIKKFGDKARVRSVSQDETTNDHKVETERFFVYQSEEECAQNSNMQQEEKNKQFSSKLFDLISTVTRRICWFKSKSKLEGKRKKVSLPCLVYKTLSKKQTRHFEGQRLTTIEVGDSSDGTRADLQPIDMKTYRTKKEIIIANSRPRFFSTIRKSFIETRWLNGNPRSEVLFQKINNDLVKGFSRSSQWYHQENSSQKNNDIASSLNLNVHLSGLTRKKKNNLPKKILNERSAIACLESNYIFQGAMPPFPLNNILSDKADVNLSFNLNRRLQNQFSIHSYDSKHCPYNPDSSTNLENLNSIQSEAEITARRKNELLMNMRDIINLCESNKSMSNNLCAVFGVTNLCCDLKTSVPVIPFEDLRPTGIKGDKDKPCLYDKSTSSAHYCQDVIVLQVSITQQRNPKKDTKLKWRKYGNVNIDDSINVNGSTNNRRKRYQCLLKAGCDCCEEVIPRRPACVTQFHRKVSFNDSYPSFESSDDYSGEESSDDDLGSSDSALSVQSSHRPKESSTPTEYAKLGPENRTLSMNWSACSDHQVVLSKDRRKHMFFPLLQADHTRFRSLSDNTSSIKTCFSMETCKNRFTDSDGCLINDESNESHVEVQDSLENNIRLQPKFRRYNCELHHLEKQSLLLQEFEVDQIREIPNQKSNRNRITKNHFNKNVINRTNRSDFKLARNQPGVFTSQLNNADDETTEHLPRKIREKQAINSTVVAFNDVCRVISDDSLTSKQSTRCSLSEDESITKGSILSEYCGLFDSKHRDSASSVASVKWQKFSFNVKNPTTIAFNVNDDQNKTYSKTLLRTTSPRNREKETKCLVNQENIVKKSLNDEVESETSQQKIKKVSLANERLKMNKRRPMLLGTNPQTSCNLVKNSVTIAFEDPLQSADGDGSVSIEYSASKGRPTLSQTQCVDSEKNGNSKSRLRVSRHTETDDSLLVTSHPATTLVSRSTSVPSGLYAGCLLRNSRRHMRSCFTTINTPGSHAARLDFKCNSKSNAASERSGNTYLTVLETDLKENDFPKTANNRSNILLHKSISRGHLRSDESNNHESTERSSEKQNCENVRNSEEFRKLIRTLLDTAQSASKNQRQQLNNTNLEKNFSPFVRGDFRLSSKLRLSQPKSMAKRRDTNRHGVQKYFSVVSVTRSRSASRFRRQCHDDTESMAVRHARLYTNRVPRPLSIRRKSQETIKKRNSLASFSTVKGTTNDNWNSPQNPLAKTRKAGNPDKMSLSLRSDILTSGENVEYCTNAKPETSYETVVSRDQPSTLDPRTSKQKFTHSTDDTYPSLLKELVGSIVFGPKIDDVIRNSLEAFISMRA